MNENRISIEMTQGDVDTIKDAVQTLIDKLHPFLIALDTPDKQGMLKMSDKSVPYVEKVVGYLDTNPEFIPPFFDAPEMKKDFSLFTQMREFLRPLVQIVSNIEDTSMLAGSEAVQGANAYYGSVKSAKKLNVPNADAIYQDLTQRFEAQRAKPKPAPKP